MFTKGGRADLAAADALQITTLETYLPKSVSGDELSKIVIETIASVGATTKKQQGLVMKAVMARLAGSRVDGKEVSKLVLTLVTE